MEFWSLITLVGSPELWVAAMLVLLSWYGVFHKQLEPKLRARMRFFVVVFAVGLMAVLATVFLLKVGLMVPRPCLPCPATGCNPYCPTEPGDYSFPSGHAAIIFAVLAAGLFGLKPRPRWWPALAAVALLVAASRVMLGVHTVPDIAAGAVIGFVLMFVTARVVRRYITA